MKKQILIAMAAIGIGLLLLRGMKPAAPQVYYPRDLTDIKRLGGFWNLSPEQQDYVRRGYLDALRWLLIKANDRLKVERSNHSPYIYDYRVMTEQLQKSLERAQHISVDPTDEQQVIDKAWIGLSR